MSSCQAYHYYYGYNSWYKNYFYYPYCTGSCAIPNSYCGAIINANNSNSCGCIYCNYDAATKRCVGTCWSNYFGQLNSLNKCLNTVPTPQSNADCACYYCNKIKDINGTITSCSGNCYASGLTCKIGQVQTSSGYVQDCYCQ